MTRELLFTLPIGCQQTQSMKRQDESGHNMPDFVRQVDVFLDPTLELDEAPIRGIAAWSYIVLREWDLAVLVHEIMHIALGPILDEPTPVERYEVGDHGHWIVTPAEMAIAPLIRILAAEDARRSRIEVPDHA